MKRQSLQHKFVELLPECLEEGTLYLSMQYATAAHKCACGCGNDVYTPLSPTDWKLTFDGRTVSLFPSVGNWSFPCRSHYWIRKSTIAWAARWSDEEIDAGRANDRDRKRDKLDEPRPKVSLWGRLRKRL